MIIKQDPVTKLWCRNDGAVLMPPDGHRFKKFRWTFGSADGRGYRVIRFRGEPYKVHQMVCRAFNGSAPIGKPEVDHINRIKGDNRPENLRWVDRKENVDNTDRVDRSIERFGVRRCDDEAAYNRTYYAAHREERKRHMRAYAANKRAEKKAQGLTRRKGPDGKYGWYPFKRA